MHRLNGIRGVDRLTDVWREREEGDDAVPVAPPGLANGGVLFVPALGKLNEGLCCLGFGGSTLN